MCRPGVFFGKFDTHETTMACSKDKQMGGEAEITLSSRKLLLISTGSTCAGTSVCQIPSAAYLYEDDRTCSLSGCT